MIIFWIILTSTAIGAVINSYIDMRGIRGINNAYKLRKMLILLTYAVLIFFASLRSKVSDTWAYAYTYQHMPASLDQVGEYVSTLSKDKTFWTLSMIFKCIISENYHVWFFFITFICCLLIASTLARYSEMPFLSAFMFILTCNFTWLFNGMRQFVAACIIFYGVKYIEQRNLKKYLIICLIAVSMHASAIVCIPIYFIVNGKAGNLKMIISMMLTLMIILGLSKILSAMNSVLAETDYDGIIEQFSSDDGVNIVRALVSAVAPILFFVFTSKEKRENVPRIIAIAVNLSIFTVLINIIGNFTSGIYIGRMSIYFEMVNLFLYPWIFRNLLSSSSRKIMISCYLLGYFAFFYYQMVITWDGFGYVSDVLNISIR